MRKLLPLALILAIIFIGAYLITPKLTPQTDVRPLGKFYLENSCFGDYSAKSPEVVTSILWDYRGVDTLFETSVFFLAIMGIFLNAVQCFFKPVKGVSDGLIRYSI